MTKLHPLHNITIYTVLRERKTTIRCSNVSLFPNLTYAYVRILGSIFQCSTADLVYTHLHVWTAPIRDNLDKVNPPDYLSCVRVDVRIHLPSHTVTRQRYRFPGGYEFVGVSTFCQLNSPPPNPPIIFCLAQFAEICPVPSFHQPD